jgi:hypothetical protein
MADRVNAAKTSPNATDTSAVPSDINPSPGDSSISPPDVGGINRAGADINGQAQQGNKATTDSARKTQSGESSKIQYDTQTVSAEDQAPTAPTEKELANTQPPKSKGFKESLIDSQMSSMIGDKTGGDHPAPDRDYGHNTPEPDIQKQPEAQPIRRDKMYPYNNSNNKVKEPAPFPISSFDKKDTTGPYKAPDQDFGPAYKPKVLNSPKVTSPNVKFNSPRFNSPKFK